MRKYVCGIDENGFGPILGPLIVTGMLTEEKIKFPPYIKDSKIFYKNKNDFKKIEEIAILSFYIIEKKIPNSPYEIFKRFVNNFCIFEDKICEKNIPLHFQNINLENLIQKHKEIIKEKEKIKEIKVKVVCPYFFNEFVSKKGSKSLLNLSLFCKIIEEMKNYKNLKFFCGKIGGITYYKYLLQYFFPEHEIKILKENINCSIYKIAKDSQCFEIGFYKDVENISPSASFSSILGKYIREIIMASIRKSLKIEEPISGYRDLKTKNSIKKIDFTRFKKNCVIRIS